MKKIVIISGVQIINTPRVVKEANQLSAAGFDVEVIGAIFDASSKSKINAMLNSVSWQHFSVIDVSQYSIFSLGLVYLKVKRRFLQFLKKYYGIESPSQLGYSPSQLLDISIKRKADLYIVHMEQGIWVGCELIKHGLNVAVDIEDWHSEDGLPEDRKLRPIKLLTSCEKFILNNSVYSTTTSKSLSFALSKAYRCSLPKVVYNSFPLSECSLVDRCVCDRRNIDVPSIIWFSQTIGPGRGLEELILALNEINLPFEFHLRGSDNRGFLNILLSMASAELRGKIFHHEQVSQDVLLSRLSEHDIGYCGDLSDCKSRDLTITNKMLEYLRANLIVVATNTAGHEEVKKLAPDVVYIFKQKNQKSLKSLLNRLLMDDTKITVSKEASIKALEGELGWNRSGDILENLALDFFKD